MERFNCTIEELNKMLSNSTLVKLHPPRGGTILTRVFKKPNGEYTSVFERTTTEPAPPPLERAAAFSDEPPTAPALAEPSNGPSRGLANGILAAKRSACRRGPPQHNTANPAAGPRPSARGPDRKILAASHHRQSKPGAARATAAASKALQ